MFLRRFYDWVLNKNKNSCIRERFNKIKKKHKLLRT
jgi:hypothetical protein